ncbi:hypothetical protein [Flavobacterium sandaracinum]|uniref:Uncharacterized protein n=1 Tax=Flavobacterium sandaracinum TaxID=2541733 RepID=A0A4R5CYT1_9FLAO|nr:hypothetical protein [Flavobacterium sandaracinum]TDE04281.1 hypothetical protein E0F91_09535 [Flavobacterium sandaracinum]
MKNYLIVIALLLFFQFNFAQESNSLEYIKAVDYVTCICINDALPTGQTFNCQTETLSKATISDSKTLALFEEFQTLKTQRNITDYLNFLSEEIFSDRVKFKKIHDFAEKRKGAKLDKIKADIKEYIRSSTTSENKESNSSESSKITSDEINSTVNNGETETDQVGIKQPKLNSENQFNIWIAMLFVLICTIAILLIRIYILLNKNVKNLNARIDRRTKTEELPNIRSHYNSQNLNENSRIEKLERNIKNLEFTISKLSSPTIYKEEKSPEVLFEVPKAYIPQSIVFYMATPNKEDGSFDISSQTETFKPTQSLYKFTVDNSNSSKAKFEFFSDEAGIRDSIDSPQTYIDPVCEPQNARNPNAKKIITTSPGTAEKRNDKWVIITNAKIKYE